MSGSRAKRVLKMHYKLSSRPVAPMVVWIPGRSDRWLTLECFRVSLKDFFILIKHAHKVAVFGDVIPKRFPRQRYTQPVVLISSVSGPIPTPCHCSRRARTEPFFGYIWLFDSERVYTWLTRGNVSFLDATLEAIGQHIHRLSQSVMIAMPGP